MKNISFQCIIGSNNNQDINLFSTDKQNEPMMEIYRKMTVALLFGDDKDRANFDDYNMERNVWEKISAMFTNGIEVEKALQNLLNYDGLADYSCTTQNFLKYFLAKLKFKRGRTAEGLYWLKSILNSKKDESDSCGQQRVKILAQMRNDVECKKIGKKYFYTLDKSIDRLETIGNVSDEYKAYEIASIVGKGVTNFVGYKHDINKSVIQEMTRFNEKHDSIMGQYRTYLANQEVVNLSLKWFVVLEKVFKERKPQVNRIEELLELSLKGFSLSKTHSNTFFYIQSIVLLAIYYYYIHEIAKAQILLELSERLMNKYHMAPTQEGLYQLHLLLKRGGIDIDIYREICTSQKAESIEAQTQEIWEMFPTHVYNLDLPTAIDETESIKI